MDRHSWPWKRKSSSKTIADKIDTEASVGSLQDQGKQKNVTYVQISVDSYKHLTGLEDQVCMLKDDVEELMNQLKDSQEKLNAANVELVSKEDVANTHAKVAEEAVSGWEKAEAEAAELRRQLESITLLKLTAEKQLSRLEGALKECMKQMRIVKEDEENIQRIVIKTQQWDAERLGLEAKVSDLDHRLLRSAAENASISRTLREQSNIISKINEEKTQEELHNELLKQKILSFEKENSSLKYELHVLSKELDIRNEENNMSLKSAEAANKQHLEDVKNIGKLEAECQKLRVLIRKKLPGPAALAQMKQEAESWDCDSVEPQKLPYKPMIKNKEIELTNRLSATEEDTKILKETLATRTSELQSSRKEYAEMVAKVRELEAHVLLADSKKFRSSEKSIHPMTADSLELMDDFLEMEKMACMENKPDKIVSTHKNEINDQQIVTALSHIHQFVLSLNKRSMQVLGASTLGKELTKDCESFSESVRKLLTNKIDLAVFTMNLSNILIQANDLVFDASNSDCIDKIRLVENEVDSKQVFSQYSPPPCNSVLILGQIKSEKNNMEAVESTKVQLEEAQLLLSNLKAELASSRKLNSLAGTQVKCMAESYKLLEVRLEESESNLKTFQAKAEDLNNLLQQEKFYRQDALVKCNDFDQKLHRRWSCPKCSLSPNADDMKNKQEQEIVAAAAKLVECQESINLLGKQLKSLKPMSNVKETLPRKRLNEIPAKHKHNRSVSSLQGTEMEKISFRGKSNEQKFVNLSSLACNSSRW
ncbi:filament-like plant protein 4 [Impatiens glandulifera]|uniref:filament-like plant protein 4 n=1 Tax=Impatiens glandulifera TaxID=253017 RepID=UPI001FB053BA|nr:filament-like plant protein 4 [Impatiens glandulifera]